MPASGHLLEIKMSRSLSVALSAPLVLLLLAGCGSHAVPVSGSHSPTDPASIKLYSKEPKKYEMLGYVRVTKNVAYGENFSADVPVDDAKAQAAAKGATGLLLWFPEKERQDMVLATAAYKGQFYQFLIQRTPTRTFLSKAIYVIEE